MKPNLAWMRFMYLYGFFGAGVVGALTLFAPAVAAETIFAGPALPTPAMSILGSLWLAMGALCLLGLWRPVRFSPLFVVQLVYKSLRLACVALPAIVAGRGGSLPLIMTALFVFWVVGLPFAIPWRHLFSPQSP